MTTLRDDVASPLLEAPADDGERGRGWNLRSLLGADPVRWLLAFMVVTWFTTFFYLCKLRHDRFATFAFDLGTYDQGVWQLAHWRQFVTVRGLPILGHHLNLILLFLAPFYRLGAGPMFLQFVMLAAQALGAVAVYLLARDRLGDRWLALVMAAVLLLNPTYQFLSWEFFHPDTLAIAPLLFAYWAARAQRWRWFAVAAVVAVLCKEDVALALAAMGVVVAIRRKIRIGALIAGLSLVWWLVATRVVMKAFLAGMDPFYDTYFGDLGSSAGEVVKNTFLRPLTTLKLLTERDRREYYAVMLSPFAFLPLVSPSTLLIAIPMLLVNALTTFPYARDYMYHYSALVLVGVMVATVEGIARLGRSPGARRFLVGAVAASTLGATVAWGLSPISVKFQDGFWPLSYDSRMSTARTALDLIPGDAAVSAIYSYVPHLSHRERIYNFPEPWKRVDWGVEGEGLHNPEVVEWFAVDRRLLSPYDAQLVDQLLSSEFTTRFDRDDVLVAQRTAPPTVSLPG